MKLVLTQPSPWPAHHVADGPARLGDDPSILVGPLELAVGPRSRWLEAVAGWERPPFTLAEVVRQRPLRSELRWPAVMVESRISDGPLVLERRLAVHYALFEWRAAVVFRASPGRFEAEVKRAERLLVSGRPDWQGEGIVALAQLRSE
jgi:hypothetical protein